MFHYPHKSARRSALGPLSLTFAVTGLFCCCQLAVAEGLSRHHHYWGRFQPGAWNLVQVVTETFEETGAATSITETRTSLEAVDDDGVTLLVKRAVGLKGKPLGNDPRPVKQPFHGVLASQEATVTNLGTGVVTIQDRRIACEIQQVEVNTPTGKITTKIYYSDSVEPYVLRRVSVKTAPDGEKVLSETTVEVVALGVPCRKISGLSRATHVKAVYKHGGGTTERVSVVSTAVPGGIVSQTSKELDENDHLVSRATLELVDWGLRPETERGGLFRRRRANRLRKLPKFTPYCPPSSPTD